MRKILFLAAMSGSTLLAQVKVNWQRSLGGEAFETSSAALVTTDGGYLVTGNTNSKGGNIRLNHGETDGWVVKLNAKGETEWEKTLGGEKEDYILSAARTTDGGYILCGYTESSDGDISHKVSSMLDAWIIKLSAAGNIEWERTIGESRNDYANAVKPTSDGGYIVVGYRETIVEHSRKTDYLLIKLNSTGVVSWQKTFGGSSDDRAYAVEETKDGYMVLGATRSSDGDIKNNHGGYDTWLIKTNLEGQLQWEKTFGGSSDDHGYGMKKTENGGIIFCGSTFSRNADVKNNRGLSDYWVVKTDANGKIKWKNTYGGSGNDYATSIDLANDGGYVVSGYTSSTDGEVTRSKGMYDYWVLKLDNNGEIAWDKCLGGTERDYSSLIMQNPDGTYTIIGDSFSTDGDLTGNQGNEDIWVAQFSPLLEPVKPNPLTAVVARSAPTEKLSVLVSTSHEEALTGRIYPNPVSDQLNIETDMEGNISYMMYNMEGSLVWSQSTTAARVNTDVSSMRPGVYILMVSNGQSQQVHRVVVQH